jgi:hypothetical protein
MKALGDVGRPLTAHELEEWLASKDPELWNEVSGKCYDYMRMILSLTRNNAIVKFKPTVQVRGHDKRVAYYGLPDGKYDETWTLVSGSRRRGRGKKKGSGWSVPPPDDNSGDDTGRSSDTLTDDVGPVGQAADGEELKEIPKLIDDVTEEAALESWKRLSDKRGLQDPLWSQLLCGLTDAKAYMQEGRDAQEMLDRILRKYPPLIQDEVVKDVMVILSREVVIIKELMLCEAVL